jgi:hypothetical protein
MFAADPLPLVSFCWVFSWMFTWMSFFGGSFIWLSFVCVILLIATLLSVSHFAKCHKICDYIEPNFLLSVILLIVILFWLILTIVILLNVILHMSWRPAASSTPYVIQLICLLLTLIKNDLVFYFVKHFHSDQNLFWVKQSTNRWFTQSGWLLSHPQTLDRGRNVFPMW